MFKEAGLAARDLYVAGFPWSACYVLDGKKPVLFEAGYACAGQLYVDAIRGILVDRSPGTLFLTHVHYDHCGAVGRLKRAFPALRVAASERSAGIIRRPNAQKLIADLSAKAISFISRGYHDPSKLVDDPFEPFDVDIILHDGQTVDLHGMTVEVIATPGHTRDMLSYYIAERKILFATESAGCLDAMGHVMVAALADYDAYFASLTKLAALPIEILCQGHRIVFLGAGEVRDFLRRSLDETLRFREKVEKLLREEEGSVDRVTARIKAEEWDANTGTKQPEDAYLINLRTTIAGLAEKQKQKEE